MEFFKRGKHLLAAALVAVVAMGGHADAARAKNNRKKVRAAREAAAQAKQARLIAWVNGSVGGQAVQPMQAAQPVIAQEEKQQAPVVASNVNAPVVNADQKAGQKQERAVIVQPVIVDNQNRFSAHVVNRAEYVCAYAWKSRDPGLQDIARRVYVTYVDSRYLRDYNASLVNSGAMIEQKFSSLVGNAPLFDGANDRQAFVKKCAEDVCFHAYASGDAGLKQIARDVFVRYVNPALGRDYKAPMMLSNKAQLPTDVIVANSKQPSAVVESFSSSSSSALAAKSVATPVTTQPDTKKQVHVDDRNEKNSQVVVDPSVTFVVVDGSNWHKRSIKINYLTKYSDKLDGKTPVDILKLAREFNSGESRLRTKAQLDLFATTLHRLAEAKDAEQAIINVYQLDRDAVAVDMATNGAQLRTLLDAAAFWGIQPLIRAYTLLLQNLLSATERRDSKQASSNGAAQTITNLRALNAYKKAILIAYTDHIDPRHAVASKMKKAKKQSLVARKHVALHAQPQSASANTFASATLSNVSCSSNDLLTDGSATSAHTDSLSGRADSVFAGVTPQSSGMPMSTSMAHAAVCGAGSSLDCPTECVECKQPSCCSRMMNLGCKVVTYPLGLAWSLAKGTAGLGWNVTCWTGRKILAALKYGVPVWLLYRWYLPAILKTLDNADPSISPVTMTVYLAAALGIPLWLAKKWYTWALAERAEVKGAVIA